VIDIDRCRRQVLCEPDAFLERLFHFLVVERVRGAVDEPAPVGDRHAAPMPEQLGDPRVAALARAARSSRIVRAWARNSLCDFALVVVPALADRMLADLAASVS
jgi:hypothetical protein